MRGHFEESRWIRFFCPLVAVMGSRWWPTETNECVCVCPKACSLCYGTLPALVHERKRKAWSGLSAEMLTALALLLLVATLTRDVRDGHRSSLMDHPIRTLLGDSGDGLSKDPPWGQRAFDPPEPQGAADKGRRAKAAGRIGGMLVMEGWICGEEACDYTPRRGGRQK